jgi:Fe-S-cluster containining protein
MQHGFGSLLVSTKDNGDAIEKRVGKELVGITREVLPGLLLAPASKRAKYIRLKKLASKALELMAPNLPCKKNCSYCCHVAVGIAESEARAISEFTGRSMEKIDRPAVMQNSGEAQRYQDIAKARYYGKPCTFLGLEGECTIYPVRPLPCRTFHVINDSAEQCDMFSGQVPVTQYDIIFPFEQATVSLFLDEIWADIREWFPDLIAGGK